MAAVITYPPELLPAPDEEDTAEIVISCAAPGCAPERPCQRCRWLMAHVGGADDASAAWSLWTGTAPDA